MVYRLDIDPLASEQIRALAAVAAAFEVLELVPERGQPISPANPTGGVYQLMVGTRVRSNATASAEGGTSRFSAAPTGSAFGAVHARSSGAP